MPLIVTYRLCYMSQRTGDNLHLDLCRRPYSPLVHSGLDGLYRAGSDDRKEEHPQACAQDLPNGGHASNAMGICRPLHSDHARYTTMDGEQNAMEHLSTGFQLWLNAPLLRSFAVHITGRYSMTVLDLHDLHAPRIHIQLPAWAIWRCLADLS